MFYHIKNLQSTKTIKRFSCIVFSFITLRIYKVLKLKYYGQGGGQSFITLRIYKVLKPLNNISRIIFLFYHIKNLQSTKTGGVDLSATTEFYHIKNLQSTKTYSRY